MGGTLKCPIWHILVTFEPSVWTDGFWATILFLPIAWTIVHERKVVKWDTWVSHGWDTQVSHSHLNSSVLTSFNQKSSIMTSPPPNFVPASWEVTASASLRFAFRALLVLIDERKSGSSFASSWNCSFLFVCFLDLGFTFYLGEAEKSESEPLSAASLSTASRNCDCSSCWLSSIASSISDSTKASSESDESSWIS